MIQPITALPLKAIQVKLTPNQSIYKWAKEKPNATAVVSGSLELSYLQLAGSIAKFIKVFEGLGIQKGMVVGLNFKDGSYHRVLELIMIFSLEVIGAIRISNPGDDDITDYCQFIFTDIPLKLSSIDQKDLGVIIISKEWVNTCFSTVISSNDLERLNHSHLPGDPIFISSTSGTTGKKKYFSKHLSLIENAREFILSTYFEGVIKNCLTIYPVDIWASYAVVSSTFMKGGTVVFTALDQFFDDVQKYPTSHSALLMKDINYLIKHFPEAYESQKLATLRVLGSHLPNHARVWVETYLTKKAFNSYSSNESSQIAETLPNGQCQVYLDVKVRIVDEDWNDLPQGDLGQVTIKSPMQISGYLWNPQLNALHFKEGWFRSNDIGYLTPQGNLVLVDRADNMLNLAGIKVPPAPIEAQIKLLSGVSDCVLLEEDTLSDLQTIAICIEASKTIDRALLEKAVITVLARRFKSYRFYYLSNFPRTESGKVKRKELQSEILKAFT
jgi:acyl-coenzyme A synthetase/AMP-(fatty) acid ligase